MSEEKDIQAFDDDRADGRMREILGDHRIEPSPGLWKGISRKLLWTELLHFNFTNLQMKFRVMGAAGLLVIATSLYLGLRGTGTGPSAAGTSEHPAGVTDPSAQPATNAPVHPASASGTPHGGSTMTTNPVAPPTLPPLRSLQAGTGEPQKLAGETPAPGNQEALSSTEWTSSAAQPDHYAAAGIAGTALTGATELYHLSPIPAEPFELFAGADTIIRILTPAGVMQVMKSPPVKSFFSAGAGITPEFAFYSLPESYSKVNCWLNGNISWHFSRFSISSGLGLGYVFDEGKYAVEYKSYDSVGFFNQVVSYTIGGNNEIIYDTRVTPVYDSLLHSDDPRTNDRYTYLQVPLLIGFRLVEAGRFSLTFRAGPSVSLMIGSRKSDPVIEYPGARIVRVDDDTPARVKTTWQLLADLYLEMRLNRNISLYADPGFRYYLNPVTEQENMTFKAPWAIGLGVGIQFNFHAKKEAQ